MIQTLVDQQHHAYLVPYREDLATLIPHAKRLQHGPWDCLVMRAGVDEARLLRNTGHVTPSPLNVAYDWRGAKPWDVQRVTAGEMALNRGMFVLNDLGTGKSRATLFAFDYLVQSGQAKRLLVVCTMSTMRRVWELEIFKFFPHLSRAVLYGTKAQRLANLKSGAQICIINHHGVGVIKNELIDAGFDVVAIDELAVFRNATTQLWKSANAVARRANYVWGLTGAPIPNAPTDAWAQIKLVAPERTTKYFGPFRDALMTRVSQFKWVPKRDAAERVFAAMQPAVRFTRDDVMELPPFTPIDRDVTLSSEQRIVYEELVKKMRTMYGGKEVLAVNEGVLLGKLLQVASGFVYTTQGGVAELPCEDRFTTLLDLLEETNRKVIVFAPFIHAVQGIYTRLKKEGLDVAMIYGDTAAGERDRIFRAFQDTTDIRVLVAHPGTMAHGLTLTAANVICWWSPVTSLEIYDQANGRINRPGQTHKTFSVRLIGSPVEKRVYTRLAQHAKLQGVLLELFDDMPGLEVAA